MSDDKKAKVMGKINEIKNNIETFISDVKVDELEASVNNMMKDAQKDINKLVDKDLVTLKNRFHKEKQLLEKKAKKFMDEHKKDIQALQTKFEKLVQKSSKTAAPVKAAQVTKKKVSRKIAKVAKKISKKKV